MAFLLSFALVSCGDAGGNKAAIDTTKLPDVSTTGDTSKTTTNAPDIDTSAFAIEYLTIADTGLNYYKLRAEMFGLHKSLGWLIDTMGRYYDTKQDKIVLSDTAYDEMYRGEYFERRYPSGNMSLEYFKVYCDTSTIKNIALVCGLYDNRKSADSLLLILKPHAAHAFVQSARLYMGCEH